MTRIVFFAVALVVALRCPPAFPAQPPTAPSAAPPSASGGSSPTAVASAPSGLAVIALPGATDAAWPLAQEVYADPSLRPPALDDANARLLCGQPATRASAAGAQDLADTVAALRGEDAPTRALLGAIANRFSVRALLVVSAGVGRPSARPFLPETGAFDAATYAPDDGAPPLRWSRASRSLARAFGRALVAAAPGPTSAPALATHVGPPGDAPPRRSVFYESGWFWGALGAAAFAGGAAFLATRDTGASTIDLQIQVPR